MSDLSIPCEFWDDAKQECRVTALFDSEAGETLWGGGCRWEIAEDPTRHRVTGCRLRMLATGRELWGERIRYVIGRCTRLIKEERKPLDKS